MSLMHNLTPYDPWSNQQKSRGQGQWQSPFLAPFRLTKGTLKYEKYIFFSPNIVIGVYSYSFDDEESIESGFKAIGLSGLATF